MTTSTPCGTAAASPRANSPASRGPLNIFQLPAINTAIQPSASVLRRHVRAGHLAGTVPENWPAGTGVERLSRFCCRNGGHAGQLPALPQLERRTAAGRDPRDARGEAELLDRPHRVAAADDGIALAGGDRLGDGLRALREPRPLEDAHGAVPEDRSRGA